MWQQEYPDDDEDWRGWPQGKLVFGPMKGLPLPTSSSPAPQKKFESVNDLMNAPISRRGDK